MRLYSLARTVDRLFTYYAVIFLAFFVFLSFADGISPTQFLVFMLLLPVFLYFSHHFWMHIYGISGKKRGEWAFSWKKFFLQESALFILSISLFSVAVSLAFVRTTSMFMQLNAMANTRVPTTNTQVPSTQQAARQETP